MGLSIYYSGRFNYESSLSEMIEEVKDIVNVLKWPYTIYENKFPYQSIDDLSYTKDVFGIEFTPPECETISITFLSNRKMSTDLHLKFYGGKDSKPDSDYLYMLSAKTQFAGIEIHQFVIHLFRHLKDKGYFSEFTLKDDGEYWETNDEKVIEENFKIYDNLLGNVAFALENFPAQKNEAFDDYFTRIMEMVHKNKKD